MKAKDLYNVAVYLRLSKDDGEAGKAESNSITSQRDIIRSFIRKQDDMEIFDFYVDDGWSGANFDRPAFKRMMSDIEAGHIDCVIVKDFSRFARDYIELGSTDICWACVSSQSMTNMTVSSMSGMWRILM